MTDIIEITHEPLAVDAITDQVKDASTGAISIFIGTTRDHFEGKKVAKLDYEAYVPMAKKELAKVCKKMRDQWSLCNIAIYHRLGEVKVTEASVVIAVTSEHRKESLEAVHFAIDDLKANVPIWKKEVYDNDAPAWKQNKECKWKAVKSEKEIPNSGDRIEVDPDEIQLNVPSDVINARMEAFMNRKRQEIDHANVLEFCDRHYSEENEYSCARTDSFVSKRTGANSHLRQTQVENPCGPQTGNYMDKSFDPLQFNMAKIKTETNENPKPETGVEERLINLEKKTGLKNIIQPVPKDVYARLKVLEDRVNYLEGMSPEYFTSEGIVKVANASEVKADSSIADLDRKTESQRSLSVLNSKIQELQDSLKQNVKSEPS